MTRLHGCTHHVHLLTSTLCWCQFTRSSTPATRKDVGFAVSQQHWLVTCCTTCNLGFRPRRWTPCMCGTCLCVLTRVNIKPQAGKHGLACGARCRAYAVEEPACLGASYRNNRTKQHQATETADGTQTPTERAYTPSTTPSPHSTAHGEEAPLGASPHATQSAHSPPGGPSIITHRMLET